MFLFNKTRAEGVDHQQARCRAGPPVRQGGGGGIRKGSLWLVVKACRSRSHTIPAMNRRGSECHFCIVKSTHLKSSRVSGWRRRQRVFTDLPAPSETSLLDLPQYQPPTDYRLCSSPLNK